MQTWTTVTTILSDLISLAGGIITLAAIEAQRRTRRRRRVLHNRRGGS